MRVPDEFDEAAARVAGGTTSRDPIDQAAAAVVQDQRTAMRSSLYNALLANPDMAARAQVLGRQAGLPPSVVERNLPQVQRNVRLDEFDRILTGSPTVARWLADEQRAKVSHDDTENLSGVESTVRFFKNTGRAAQGGALSMSGGALGVLQAPFDLAAPFLDPLVGTVLPANPVRNTAEGIARWRQSIEAQANAVTPKADDILGAGYYSGIGSLTRNLLALPLVFFNPAAALTAMTAPVFGEEFGKARDKGMQVLPALTFGASQAAIEYATEKIPVSKLVGDLKAGAPLYKMLVNQLAREIPGEQVATILQDLNEWAVLKPEATFADYLRERPSAAAQTLIATIVGVGGQTTVMKGLDIAFNRVTERVNLAQDAERDAQAFELLNQLAQASQVLKRDPQSFKEFVEQEAADGPVQDVFIDARIFNQASQDAGVTIEQLPASVQGQLTQALEAGGDIRIPLADYAAEIGLGTDFNPLEIFNSPKGSDRIRKITIHIIQSAAQRLTVFSQS
jgi:putative heme iron utilization protein